MRNTKGPDKKLILVFLAAILLIVLSAWLCAPVPFW